MRIKFNLFDLLKGYLEQRLAAELGLVHRDKPLLGSAVDNGFVATWIESFSSFASRDEASARLYSTNLLLFPSVAA